MKIKFIKEYVAVDPATNSGIIHRPGETEEIKDSTAQWLIDNGFAEEVKESGWWKPKRGDKYWYIGLDNFVHLGTWENSVADNGMLKLGLIFKTEKAGVYRRDYLEAVVTVKQDEGVLTPEEVYMRAKDNGEAYHIACTGKQNGTDELSVCEMDLYFWPPVGVMLFDTDEHAQASLDKHPDEWKIIANYDWSRE